MVFQNRIFDNGQDYRSKLLNGFKEHISSTPDETTEEQEVEFHASKILVLKCIFTKVYNGKIRASRRYSV